MPVAVTGANGPGIYSCQDSGGSSSGTGWLNTSALGTGQTYTVTATNGNGDMAASSITYTVAAAPSASITTPPLGSGADLESDLSTLGTRVCYVSSA
ncbi:MAG: hypothetical protein M3070_02460 [Actinomycetota bacterium]|nr:hypothetical protein [Actinomycetota bacterium]